MDLGYGGSTITAMSVQNFNGPVGTKLEGWTITDMDEVKRFSGRLRDTDGQWMATQSFVSAADYDALLRRNEWLESDWCRVGGEISQRHAELLRDFVLKLEQNHWQGLTHLSAEIRDAMFKVLEDTRPQAIA